MASVSSFLGGNIASRTRGISGSLDCISITSTLACTMAAEDFKKVASQYSAVDCVSVTATMVCTVDAAEAAHLTANAKPNPDCVCIGMTLVSTLALSESSRSAADCPIILSTTICTIG